MINPLMPPLRCKWSWIADIMRCLWIPWICTLIPWALFLWLGGCQVRIPIDTSSLSRGLPSEETSARTSGDTALSPLVITPGGHIKGE